MWPFSRKPQNPLTIAYPHAVVNLHVTQEAVDLLKRGYGGEAAEEGTWASSTVVLGRAVLHLNDRSKITLEQARGLAHELSHITAKLLGIKDRTHEKDGGRL